MTMVKVPETCRLCGSEENPTAPIPDFLSRLRPYFPIAITEVEGVSAENRICHKCILDLALLEEVIKKYKIITSEPGETKCYLCLKDDIAFGVTGELYGPIFVVEEALKIKNILPSDFGEEDWASGDCISKRFKGRNICHECYFLVCSAHDLYKRAKHIDDDIKSVITQSNGLNYEDSSGSEDGSDIDPDDVENGEESAREIEEEDDIKDIKPIKQEVKEESESDLSTFDEDDDDDKIDQHSIIKRIKREPLENENTSFTEGTSPVPDGDLASRIKEEPVDSDVESAVNQGGSRKKSKVSESRSASSSKKQVSRKNGKRKTNRTSKTVQTDEDSSDENSSLNPELKQSPSKRKRQRESEDIHENMVQTPKRRGRKPNVDKREKINHSDSDTDSDEHDINRNGSEDEGDSRRLKRKSKLKKQSDQEKKSKRPVNRTQSQKSNISLNIKQEPESSDNEELEESDDVTDNKAHVKEVLSKAGSSKQSVCSWCSVLLPRNSNYLCLSCSDKHEIAWAGILAERTCNVYLTRLKLDNSSRQFVSKASCSSKETSPGSLSSNRQLIQQVVENVCHMKKVPLENQENILSKESPNLNKDVGTLKTNGNRDVTKKKRSLAESESSSREVLKKKKLLKPNDNTNVSGSNSSLHSSGSVNDKKRRCINKPESNKRKITSTISSDVDNTIKEITEQNINTVDSITESNNSVSIMHLKEEILDSESNDLSSNVKTSEMQPPSKQSLLDTGSDNEEGVISETSICEASDSVLEEQRVNNNSLLKDTKLQKNKWVVKLEKISKVVQGNKLKTENKNKFNSSSAQESEMQVNNEETEIAKEVEPELNADKEKADNKKTETAIDSEPELNADEEKADNEKTETAIGSEPEVDADEEKADNEKTETAIRSEPEVSADEEKPDNEKTETAIGSELELNADEEKPENSTVNNLSTTSELDLEQEMQVDDEKTESENNSSKALELDTESEMQVDRDTENTSGNVSVNKSKLDSESTQSRYIDKEKSENAENNFSNTVELGPEPKMQMDIQAEIKTDDAVNGNDSNSGNGVLDECTVDKIENTNAESNISELGLGTEMQVDIEEAENTNNASELDSQSEIPVDEKTENINKNTSSNVSKSEMLVNNEKSLCGVGSQYMSEANGIVNEAEREK